MSEDDRTDDEGTLEGSLAQGLKEHSEEVTPDGQNWCTNCEQYAEFEVLDTIRRPEFGVQNEIRGCPDCKQVVVPSSEWEQMPESHQKGDRHECQGRQILDRRFRANRVPSNYGNNDPFHLADLMGLQGGLPFVLVQIKTNRFTAEERRYYRSWASDKVDGEHTIFEVWVRTDRDGWEMYRFDPETGEFESYYETSTCDPDEVRDEWVEAFDSKTPRADGVQSQGADCDA